MPSPDNPFVIGDIEDLYMFPDSETRGSEQSAPERHQPRDDVFPSGSQLPATGDQHVANDGSPEGSQMPSTSNPHVIGDILDIQARGLC
ncbi:hypothetical protein K3495_g8020 [Podosphaera aphanis]|nr:hypothetical protein K3495_g8020 [Podosphaera aphanis]